MPASHSATVERLGLCLAARHAHQMNGERRGCWRQRQALLVPVRLGHCGEQRAEVELGDGDQHRLRPAGRVEE